MVTTYFHTLILLSLNGFDSIVLPKLQDHAARFSRPVECRLACKTRRYCYRTEYDENYLNIVSFLTYHWLVVFGTSVDRFIALQDHWNHSLLPILASMLWLGVCENNRPSQK